MKTKERILGLLLERKKLSTQDVVSHFKISRQYANSILRELTKEGRVLKIGSTKSSIYVLPQYAKHIDVIIKKRLRNEYLEEHKVLNDIENQLLPLSQFSDNTRNIFEYAFSEMLNNAIEHSQSEFINIEAKRNKKFISFIVDDFGIGVFKNVMQKKNLNSELEAIQDLLKGKTTTQPQAHSGEGIFFTSKVADIFILESFDYRLRVDNTLPDVFIEELKSLKKGTRVKFFLKKGSKKHLSEVFEKYRASVFEVAFDKTEVRIKLFTMGTIYISRSQARRVVAGLDKFKSIILDFDKVPTIGQAFADEIFRVFAERHPDIKIESINTNKTVRFMIDRVEKDKREISEEKTGKLI